MTGVVQWGRLMWHNEELWQGLLLAEAWRWFGFWGPSALFAPALLLAARVRDGRSHWRIGGAALLGLWLPWSAVFLWLEFGRLGLAVPVVVAGGWLALALARRRGVPVPVRTALAFPFLLPAAAEAWFWVPHALLLGLGGHGQDPDGAPTAMFVIAWFVWVWLAALGAGAGLSRGLGWRRRLPYLAAVATGCGWMCRLLASWHVWM